MALAAVSLDDKYALERGRVFLTGTQALVRLPMVQRRRDAAAGLDTAGFISGYRGSPLGAVDQQLWAARRFLAEHAVHFQPAVNEDLAATAVWGSQQASLYRDALTDGVFAMWYGKGPGVDRSGDVFRHGNMAGSAPHGGVLLLAGDDHMAKSSTLAAQSEYAFMDAMIPVLSPAGVQEILDLGLYGWAMSRASGCWVAFKCLTDVIDSSASVSVDPERVAIAAPEGLELPPGGLNIRWPDDRLDQEERLHRHKLYAALAFARANGLDRRVIDGPKRRLGIVATGKAYLDLRQALEDLGIDDAAARDMGLSVYKVSMPWPLEREGVRAFAEGLEEILVVEEKRALVENQLKEQLYNWRADVRPRVVGKYDEAGRWILPSSGELTPARVARVLAERIARFHDSEAIEARLAFLEAKERQLASGPPPLTRLPYFCSGCPHNTSTRVPEGSRALAGIGCHFMALWMDRNTETFTQMGGEGVTWVGQAPFSKTKHVFANLGDGTYYHSGLLAVRACVAAGVNMTFKILYNDAVAMTGGQPMDGPLDPPAISRQLAAEGVADVRIVTDEPDKYPVGTAWAEGVSVHERHELDRVQRELREIPGVSALIYDQTCAAEKRRRRKRGRYPDPPRRAFINDLVCEGCGDCGRTSNCTSVVPLETEYGSKRAIDQSSCNKDFTCLDGFCPSFVTVHGGRPRKQAAGKGEGAADDWPALPEPEVPSGAAPFDILVTGIGGTGVVTIGALLGMAAHIEGKGCSVLDQTGLAQKGGAVVSHVRIAGDPTRIHAARISAGGADLLLGCDLVVAAGDEALAKAQAGRTRAVVNAHETVTGDFARDSDYRFPGSELRARIREETGEAGAEFLEATRLATALMGDSIAGNLFMLGYAYQRGCVPVSEAALFRAIELNGVAVAANKQAFAWGRRAAHDPAAVERAAGPRAEPAEPAGSERLAESLDEAIGRRVAELTAYQDAAYAHRYRRLVERARAAEAACAPGGEAFAWAVARGYFKLLALKDEYEVGRLFTSGEFRRKLSRQFEGDIRLTFHLAPPILGDRDPETGHLKKREFGPWMFRVFQVLAKFRRLRGTPLDVFSYTAERRRERALAGEYEALMEEVVEGLTRDNYATAVELAGLPEAMRGFGHVKEANVRAAKAREAELLADFRAPTPSPERAAAE